MGVRNETCAIPPYQNPHYTLIYWALYGAFYYMLLNNHSIP